MCASENNNDKSLERILRKAFERPAGEVPIPNPEVTARYMEGTASEQEIATVELALAWSPEYRALYKECLEAEVEFMAPTEVFKRPPNLQIDAAIQRIPQTAEIGIVSKLLRTARNVLFPSGSSTVALPFRQIATVGLALIALTATTILLNRNASIEGQFVRNVPIGMLDKTKSLNGEHTENSVGNVLEAAKSIVSIPINAFDFDIDTLAMKQSTTGKNNAVKLMDSKSDFAQTLEFHLDGKIKDYFFWILLLPPAEKATGKIPDGSLYRFEEIDENDELKIDLGEGKRGILLAESKANRIVVPIAYFGVNNSKAETAPTS